MNTVGWPLRIFLVASLTIILGGIGLGFYWAFWPYPGIPDDITNVEILNENNTVRAGEPIRYRSVLTVPYRMTIIQTRYLIDGTVIQFPSIRFVSSGEPFNLENSTSVVPDYAPSGTYVLRIVNCYQVNVIRQKCLVRTTEPFRVLGLVRRGLTWDIP